MPPNPITRLSFGVPTRLFVLVVALVLPLTGASVRANIRVHPLPVLFPQHVDSRDDGVQSMATCGSTPASILTLHTGDAVSGVAVLRSSDPDEGRKRGS